MGFRFRKSMKIAPGVRMNLGTKSAGLSFGGKGFRYSVNSSGRRTTTVGIPGTGMSWSKSSTSSQNHGCLWWLFIGSWWYILKWTCILVFQFYKWVFIGLWWICKKLFYELPKFLIAVISENVAKRKPKKAPAKIAEPLKKTEPSYPWDETWPNPDTDYANVNFLNCNSRGIHKYPRANDEFGRWVSYHLGIVNPCKKYSDLLALGYFQKATPEEILLSMKNEELKSILTGNGLSSAGKKADLVRRIMDSITVSSLSLPDMYKLTEKAKDYIKANYDLVLLSKNPYTVTYEEYLSVKNDAPPYLKYNDLIWRVFQIRDFNTPLTDLHGRASNCRNRGLFLEKEEKLVDALEYYIWALYLSIHYDNELYDYISEPIVRLGKFLTDEHINRCYSRVDIMDRKISKEKLKELITDIISGKEIDEIDLTSYGKFKKPLQ